MEQAPYPIEHLGTVLPNSSVERAKYLVNAARSKPGHWFRGVDDKLYNQATPIRRAYPDCEFKASIEDGHKVLKCQLPVTDIDVNPDEKEGN